MQRRAFSILTAAVFGVVMLAAQSGLVRAVGEPSGASLSGHHAMGPTPAPLVFTQQGAKLVASDGVGAVEQGSSVALSADGNTALVGSAYDGGGAGAAWVWVRSGGLWAQQGLKLVGTGAVGVANQGHSVALSADGNTALVGGYADSSSVGAVWVWTRSGGVWTQEGPKLVGTGAVGTARQGGSVALSADGNTALVGGYGDSGVAGAVWVWTRSGGVWTQQGAKLVGSGAVGAALQGWAVSLSASGNTALVGGYADAAVFPFYSAGAAWVWTRSGGVWTQQGPKLVGAGSVSASQGWSVSLSADGNTALVGGPDSGGGAAWVWTRSGGVWAQEGPRLVGSGGAGNARQGRAVALSADGNTALVGGPQDDYLAAELSYVGAAWVWTRAGGVWTQRGAKLVGAGAVGGGGQGSAVALSGSGNTALVGGPYDYGHAGAVWVYTAFADDGDVDGDGMSDRTIFRPSTGAWFSLLSGGGATATGFGTTGDVDVAADYDGDGKVDIAVWRPSEGTWYIVESGTASVRIVNYGIAGDIPLAGDVDGDGRADLAIFRASTGFWFLHLSSGLPNNSVAVGFGTTGDQPLLADYDGDHKADLTIFRPSTGAWYVAKSGGGGIATGFGATGDVPVTGDWDGDGLADLAVFRPSAGAWFISKSSGGGLFVSWGAAGDVPLVGDWDGDGKSDYTVFRPSTGAWFTQFAIGGSAAVGFGTTGDKPIGRVPGS